MTTSKAKKTNTPALRFNEFQANWVKKLLREVTMKVNSGKTPLGGEATYLNQGVFFIRSQNINNDRLELGNSVFISVETNNEMKNSKVKANDILLNITGASLGRSCVVPHDFEIGNVNQHVCIVRVSEEYNPRYIQPILSSSKGQNIFQALQTGCGREGLNFESIKGIAIYFPSVEEQDKIANFLSLIDERIATQIKIIEELKSLKRLLIEKIFTRQIRFKDNSGKDFPEWQESKLGGICEFLDGKRKPIKESERQTMKGQYPYYGASGIIDFVNDYIFSEDLILLGEDGENIVSRNLPLVFKAIGKYWVNNHAHVLKPKQNQNIDFLVHCLERISYLPYNTGTAQPKLNQEICKQIPLNMPSISEQIKIANCVSAIDVKLDNEKKLFQQYGNQKKYLLNNLFI